MHQHTTRLPPIALTPPEATAPPSLSRASGSCHNSKTPKCHGYKGAPSCSLGSLTALVPDKGACWPLADSQRNCLSCSSENGSNISFTKQLTGSVRILCSSKMCAHFLKENIICISSSWRTLLKNIGFVCLYLGGKKIIKH